MFNSGEKGYRYETKYFIFLKISIVMNCANDHTWSRRGKRSWLTTGPCGFYQSCNVVVTGKLSNIFLSWNEAIKCDALGPPEWAKPYELWSACAQPLNGKRVQGMDAGLFFVTAFVPVVRWDSLEVSGWGLNFAGPLCQRNPGALKRLRNPPSPAAGP